MDLGAHRLAQAGVQRGERFVEQHQGRAGRQRPRQGDALLLSARQLAGAAVLEPTQAHEVEHLRDPRRAAALRPREPERDVVPDAEVREQGPFLRDQRDARRALAREVAARAADDGVTHPDLATVGPCMKPADRVRSNVVLPHPDGPSTAVTELLGTPGARRAARRGHPG